MDYDPENHHDCEDEIREKDDAIAALGAQLTEARATVEALRKKAGQWEARCNVADAFAEVATEERNEERVHCNLAYLERDEARADRDRLRAALESVESDARESLARIGTPEYDFPVLTRQSILSTARAALKGG